MDYKTGGIKVVPTGKGRDCRWRLALSPCDSRQECSNAPQSILLAMLTRQA